MGDALRDFEWEVAADYECQTVLRKDDPGHAELVLAEKLTGPRRRYRPLDRQHATLFRTFARTDSSPDGVLSFARRYGLLGGAVSMYQNQGLPYVASGRERLAGDAPETWQGQISRMRMAVELFDALAAHNGPALDHYHRLIAKVPLPLIVTPQEKETWSVTPPGSRSAVTQFLRWMVETSLKDVSPKLARSNQESGLRLIFAPRSLIDAMWLQLAMAITEQKRYPPCRHCGNPFEIARGETGFRKNREFCSDRCKSADYRARRSKAIRLARRGIATQKIAERTETDLGTIKDWLRAVKKGR
jgi:hypothetical protein